MRITHPSGLLLGLLAATFAPSFVFAQGGLTREGMQRGLVLTPGLSPTDRPAPLPLNQITNLPVRGFGPTGAPIANPYGANGLAAAGFIPTRYTPFYRDAAFRMGAPAGGIPANQLCRAAIGIVERESAVPPQLMVAIGRVESGRRDPQTGSQNPWPWTINVEGQGYFYDTKAQVIAAVKDFQAKGIQSIDVGCMQVNLMHHPNAFATLEAAFDPLTNARYAARFLNELFARTHDWAKATGNYHSATPDLSIDYARKVLAVLPQENGVRQPVATPAQIGTPTQPEPVARYAVSLPMNRLENIRILPLSASGTPVGGTQVSGAGSFAGSGRSLDAYRANPILVTSPTLRRGG